MKRIYKSLISLVLTLAVLAMATIPAFASRRTYFLSDLHLAEASSADEAKKMLTDNGYTVINKNLNPEGETAVYLGYKTSSNVEDAITDISVMNMDGGYNITSYDSIFKEALEGHKATVENLRVAAKEFKANYEKGERNALVAYRQLNYYYYDRTNPETKETTRILMGDYMLAFPEKDEEFADILFKGNANILNNIRSLLAMGIGKGGGFEENVKALLANEAIYDKHEYYDIAKTIHKSLAPLDRLRDDAVKDIEAIKLETELTEDEKNAATVIYSQTVALVTAIEAILMNIKVNGTDLNYFDYVATTTEPDYSVYYPLIEAMTPGQRALCKDGQITSVLVYDEIEMDEKTLNEELEKIETDFITQSVFLGSDLTMFEGSLALTEGAVRYEKSSGATWLAGVLGDTGALIMSSIFSAAGIAIAVLCTKYLFDFFQKWQDLAKKYEEIIANDYFTISIGENNETILDIVNDDTVVNAVNTKNQAANGATASGSELHISRWEFFGPTLGLAVGIIMLSYGIYNLIEIISSYNVEYTDIPDNIIDAVDTTGGKRYIRYNVVESFYKDGDEMKTRAGDTNAYDGQQWNAIYYTKNYEAGKCLTSSMQMPKTEDGFGRYAPVHPFGIKTLCYNLNNYSHDNQDEIFLAFNTSSAKKAAETNVPTVVGSIFNYGLIALSGVCGIGVGAGVMALIQKKKKSKAETPDVPTEGTEPKPEEQ